VITPQPEGYPAYAYQYPVPEPGRFSRFLVRLYDRSPRWAGPAAIACCMAGATAYVMVSDPTDGNAGSVPTCLVRLTTGFDCPGCGGTRAFWYLIHGNIPAAARHHAMFLFAVPFLIYMYVAWTANLVLGRKALPQPRLSARTIGLFLAAWGAFTVLRNLPWAPFTSLYV
jgi:hypothetical protein